MSTTASTAMPTSAAIEQPPGTDGSTIRSTAVAPLIQTALQRTGLVPRREAIHWPAVKRALSNKSPVKSAILEVRAAEVAISALAGAISAREAEPGTRAA